MSLFGLFREKDCEFYKQKGEKLFHKQDFYNALINFEKALEKDCEQSLKEKVEEKIEECKKRLAEKNLELAKAYFEAEDFDEAVGFAETCIKYAVDKGVKEEAENIIREIEMGELELQRGSKREYVYEDVEDDEYFEIISEHYPDFIKKELEENDELKKICIEINRGNLDKAEKIEEFPDSYASNYMKVLYFSLKEDYEKAFEIFNTMFNEKKDEFTEAMLCEYLELTRRLEKEDDLIEKVLDVGGNYLDVVKLAASIYLERDNLERSEELVEYGFEIMDKLNPDRELIATAGLLYFQKKEYKKCVDYLGSLKEMYARMGYFVFPPEMAIPLAYSYSQLNKHNEGLELLLHLIKETKDPEAIKLAEKIAEKSDREDLKKQLKYLVE
ncbi:hypothetical protein TTHT_1480 [Thermotomaculum hydrothermale]|uniref:TPR repeat-containing protein n=1 Tax=Thermotomaculum hydrothermale TaxID=981385 RepID=A0A7R6PFW6_9BACT|nr:hypothetical protein [Thermotomaculum hydrothermale]BBB32988.1 hypothetical protein TTHT_1480 [Thermotomaculum hydrothermale]